MKNRFKVTDILIFIAAAVYAVGLKTLFRSCGPMEDGSWMTCHWAEQAAFGAAVALLIIAALRFVSANPGVKLGISIASIPVSLLGIVFPGVLIRLCMMNTMRCHAVMRPFCIVMSVLIIILSVIDIIIERGPKENEDAKA